MQNLLSKENVVSSPIQEGDAGLILKPDGSFRVFSTGKIDPANLSSEQFEQGRKLQALALALSIPQVMQVLFQMTEDSTITGAPGFDVGAKH